GVGGDQGAALPRGGGHARRGKCGGGGEGERDERLVGGLANGANGGGDAPAGAGDGEVVGARAAEGELAGAVSGPDEVGVRVDEARGDEAASGVEDLRRRADAPPGDVTLGADPGHVSVLDADRTARDGPEHLLGAATVRPVGREERAGVTDEDVEGTVHR